MKRLAVLLSVLLAASVATAQVDRAAVTGVVRDATGGVLGNASVSARGESGATVVRTTGDGVYQIPSLAPGAYSIEVEVQGFAKQARAVRLEVGQRAQVDFTVKVGASEDVTVTEPLPLLNTGTAAVGHVVDQPAIQNLPLAIRAWDDLLALVPGVQGDRFTEEGGGTAFGRTGGVNVHGNRSLQNNFLLDGVDNNSISENVQELTTQASRPSLDAIGEFKVVTSAYAAEYGRAPGAAISVTTRSGTNALRGSVYGYFRDARFDSNTYFNDEFRTARGLDPLPKPANDQKQFGGNLGGPIVRDKLFFFADYEGTRITRGTTRITNVPTMAERSGVFTGTIRDPLTGLPFPGSTIPASRIDPTAAAMFALLPAPNAPGATNYVRPDAEITDDVDRYLGRLDFKPTAADTIFLRYIRTNRDRSIPGAFGGLVDGTGTSAFGDQAIDSESVVGGWTRILGPSVVNELRVSWTAVDSDAVQQPFGQETPAAALVPGVPDDPRVNGGIAGISIDGYFGGSGLGRMGSPDFLPKYQHTRQLELLDTVSWLAGNHQVKLGIDVLAPMKNDFLDVPATRGSFRFRGRFTGNAVADFLLGYASDAQLSNVWEVNQRRWATSFFAQDDWRVTERLTLNLGLRYDFMTPALEAQNEMINFDPATQSVLSAADGSLEDRALVKPDRNNIAPRVGFVYRATESFLVRGGYGLFYNLFDRIGSEDQLALNPPGLINTSLSTSSATTPLLVLSQGFPADFLDPAKIDYRRIRIRAADSDSPNSAIQQYSVGAEKTFANAYVLSIDLVGSKGKNLANLVNLNQPIGGNGALPYPGFGFIEWREEKGSSDYKGMDLGFTRRFTKGWGFGLSYTLSKCTDDTAEHLATGGSPSFSQDARNLDAWRGPCGYDTRHRFAGHFVAELPIARGAAGVTKAILGGWTLSGVYAQRGGRPFTVTQGSNNVGQGHTGLPNQIGSGEGPQTIDKWFEPADFQAVPSGTFGNAGRNILRGPGWKGLDLSLQKAFDAGRARLSLRWDVFNVFNTVNLGLPDSNISNTSTVGTIRSLAGDPRLMQFSARLTF